MRPHRFALRSLVAGALAGAAGGLTPSPPLPPYRPPRPTGVVPASPPAPIGDAGEPVPSCRPALTFDGLSSWRLRLCAPF